jgi:hypothetical protein
MIIVWQVPWIQKKLQSAFPALKGRPWSDFCRWTLYEGTLRLQNAFRLVQFFKTIQVAWQRWQQRSIAAAAAKAAALAAQQ